MNPNKPKKKDKDRLNDKNTADQQAQHPQQHQSPDASAPTHNPQLLKSPWVPGQEVRCNGPATGAPGVCTGKIIAVKTSLGRPDSFSYELSITPLTTSKLQTMDDGVVETLLPRKGIGYQFLHDPNRNPTETKLFCAIDDQEGIQQLAKIASVDNSAIGGQ